jgi:hypothetical protein
MTQAFNLSQFANNVDSSGKAILTSGQAVTGILPVANGGSGAATFASGSVLLGSGTSSFGTVAPGTSGNLLTSNGSAWISQTPALGVNIEVFTISATWTVPAGITKALVWVFGGAGGGARNYWQNYSGGTGGYLAGLVTGLSGSVIVTVGAGGNGSDVYPNGTGTAGTAGSLSSFGSYIICNGGTAANIASGAGSAGTGSYGTGATRVRAICGVESSWSKNQYGLSSGRSNTTWNITYTEYPGQAFNSSGTSSSANGMGGAVIIQY